MDRKKGSTAIYMALEMIIVEENPFSNKSDVYAFLMILYEMFSQKQPFKILNIFELHEAIKKAVF